MDFNRFVSIGVVFFAFCAEASAARPVYPKIKDLDGVVLDLSQQPTRTLKKADRLLEKFHARLSDPSSHITIDLYEKLELEAYSGSEFLMPNISWETRQISDVQLLKGWIQLDSQSKELTHLKIKSPLFEVPTPEGNLVLYFHPDQAEAGILVFKGEVVFGGLNAEETVIVKAGEKVSYQGVKEEDEISYDLLLHGRKVPKGKLGKVQKISSDEYKKYSPDVKLKRKQEKSKHNTKISQEGKLSMSHQICRNPSAPLNYCKWSWNSQKQCLRQRCTADGLWKDAQIVSDGQCGKKIQVKNCDY